MEKKLTMQLTINGTTLVFLNIKIRSKRGNYRKRSREIKYKQIIIIIIERENKIKAKRRRNKKKKKNVRLSIIFLFFSTRTDGLTDKNVGHFVACCCCSVCLFGWRQLLHSYCAILHCTQHWGEANEWGKDLIFEEKQLQHDTQLTFRSFKL